MSMLSLLTFEVCPMPPLGDPQASCPNTSGLDGLCQNTSLHVLSLFRLEQFHWFGGEMRKVAVGDRVMQVVQKGRAMEFCPPARVVSIYRYRVGREYRWIFSLETRKKARVLLTTDMRSKLSKEEIAALKSNDVRLVSTEELRRKIGLVWALEE
jgi:hypothetical protein